MCINKYETSEIVWASPLCNLCGSRFYNGQSGKFVEIYSVLNLQSFYALTKSKIVIPVRNGFFFCITLTSEISNE